MSDMSLFSPLANRDFCLWFYFLSIAGFVFLIVSVLSAIIVGIRARKDSGFYIQMFLLSLGYFIFYFQNRLLYSMCAKSM